MPRKAQNEPIPLHAEQESSQKDPLERLEGEPAHWYLRFRTYAMMGRGRSIQAVLADEKGLLPARTTEEREAQIGTEVEKINSSGASLDEKHVALFELADKMERQGQEDRETRIQATEALTITIPGSWKRASKTWHWVERAKQYDAQVRMEHEQELFNYLQDVGMYISKAQRLAALDMLISSMFTQLFDGQFKHLPMSNKDGQKAFINWIKTVQGLLKQIHQEMCTIDLTPVRKEQPR